MDGHVQVDEEEEEEEKKAGFTLRSQRAARVALELTEKINRRAPKSPS